MSVQKTALVTGSTRGIGFACAKRLGENGYTVILSGSKDDERSSSVLKGLQNAGVRCVYQKCDISSARDRAEMTDFIESRFGRLDVLVNNAGVAPLKRTDILQTGEESFDRVVGVNLKGTFFMCQSGAGLMIRTLAKNKDYSPRIINISSVSAYASSPSRGEYCVSKAGISMVTALFADRLAEYGIPVFEVRPGIILTDMTASVREKYEKMIGEGLTPVKRFGTPDDVADCVMAACGGLLDFSTGQILNADGGFHLRRL